MFTQTDVPVELGHGIRRFIPRIEWYSDEKMYIYFSTTYSNEYESEKASLIVLADEIKLKLYIAECYLESLARLPITINVIFSVKSNLAKKESDLLYSTDYKLDGRHFCHVYFGTDPQYFEKGC